MTERGVVPYINVEGAAAASEFYQRAFAAKELFRMPAQDGQRLMHCHLEINGGSLMLSDCFPEMGMPHQPSNSFTMHLNVQGVQDWWDRAVEAGAEVVSPLQVMFWGDRYGQLRDRFGVNWSMGEPA
jgi:uncharacterized glyoxalase superfamily protein PhnB